MKKLSDFFSRRRREHVRREIFSVLAKGMKNGVVDEASRNMIENILDFSSTLVREIMIPRTDIVAIDADDAAKDVIQEIIEARYTRLPVYKESIDNIIGILNIKDILPVWSPGMNSNDILSSLTKPYYIPETKNAHLLFYEFKNNKKHIAIVIDEYGGTSGMVTLEDLLEEIVGEILDEHEAGTDSGEIIRIGEGEMIVEGRTEIEKIEEHLNITLAKGRYETIGGLILNTVRRIPHRGENFQINGMHITIESADERRIQKVKIKRMHEEESEPV